MKDRKRIKISVVIPIYNAEKTLNRCIDSVLHQSLQEIELVCVDDCSQDNSYNILTEYVKKDYRIKITRNETNLHAGVSRNRGIEIAEGEYLYFLDADDYLLEDVLEKLYVEAHKFDLEVIKAKAKSIDLLTNEEVIIPMNSLVAFPNELFNIVTNFYENPVAFRCVSCAPWNGIYKRDFINNNNIRFNSLMCVNDRSFYFNVLVKARRIMVVDYEIISHMINNSDSLVGLRHQNFNCHFKSYNIINSLVSDLPNKYKYRILDAELNDMVAWFKRSNDIELYEKTFIELKKFFENIDLSFFERLSVEIGESLNRCIWYPIYLDVMTLSDKEFAIKNKIHFHRIRIDESFEIKISIIIPVYNVEEYIEECLNSIIFQTLKEIEIICIDDCSTDNSLEIIRMLGRKDPRIKIISYEKNRSASQARKDGVMAAVGKYILFVDADDSLKKSALENLYIEMEKNPVDILHFGTEIINEGNLPQNRIDNMKKFVAPYMGTLTEFEVFESCFESKKYRFSLWNKMYDSALCKLAFSHIKDGSFPKAQDLYAYFVISFYAESYRGLPDNIYYEYHFGRGATGHNLLDFPEFKRYCEMGLVADAIHDFLEEESAIETYKNAYHNVRQGIVRDCVNQWNNHINDFEKSDAFALMIQYFKSSEIIAAIVASNMNNQGSIVKFLANSCVFDINKNEIYTIGMYYPRLSNGGVQRVMSLLSEIYVNMNYKVVIFCEEEPSENNYRLPDNISIILLPGIQGKSENLDNHLRFFNSQLLLYNVDVLIYHAWYDYFGLLASMFMVKSCGIPFIIYCHNIFSAPILNASLFFGDMPYIYSMADCIVVLSDADNEYWRQFNDNVITVSNPLTFDIIEMEETQSNNKNILWIARISKEKRPMDAIDVFNMVLKKEPDAKLFIVGGTNDVSYLKLLEQHIKQYKLEKKVVVTGFVKNVDFYYRDAAVLLSTSLYEGCPMTLSEGQSFGLPIVMYELPWLKITKGNKGIVAVPQNDKEKAADAIIKILQNNELKRSLSAEARENVKALLEFDLENTWKLIFNNIINPIVKKRCGQISEMHETFYSHYKELIITNRSLGNSNRKIRISPKESLTEIELIEKLIWNRSQKDFLSKENENLVTQLKDANYHLSEIRKSKTYKIGRFITWLPRKIRTWVKK